MFRIDIQICKEGLRKTTLNCNSKPKPTPSNGNTSKNRLLCIFSSYMYFKTTLRRFVKRYAKKLPLSVILCQKSPLEVEVKLETDFC